MLQTHKAFNNTAPEYLLDLNRFYVKGTTIRTRASFNPCLLCGTLISKTRANSFFDRFFVYAAPPLWNAIDLDDCPLMRPKKSQYTSRSEVPCKLILIMFIIFV